MRRGPELDEGRAVALRDHANAAQVAKARAVHEGGERALRGDVVDGEMLRREEPVAPAHEHVEAAGGQGERGLRHVDGLAGRGARGPGRGVREGIFGPLVSFASVPSPAPAIFTDSKARMGP